MQTLDKYTSPAPGYGLQYDGEKTKEVNNRVIKTNGKAEIRVKVGTRPVFRRWSLTWNLPPALAIELEDMIDATADVDSMLFTEPVTGRKYTVVTDGGAKVRFVSNTMYVVSAEVREVAK